MEKGRVKAMKPAQEALSMAKKLSSKVLIAHALYQVGTVHTLTGRIGEAMQAANEARSIFHARGDRFNETAVVMLMAETQFAGQKEDRAVQIAEEAIAMAEAIGDVNTISRAKKLIDTIRPPQPTGPPDGWVCAQPQQPQARPSEAAEVASLGGAILEKVPEEKGLDYDTVSRAVKEVAKAIVGSDEGLNEDAALMDSGMDSLSALSFRQSLAQQVNVKLPSSFVFDYPTMREVTNRIVELSKE